MRLPADGPQGASISEEELLNRGLRELGIAGRAGLADALMRYVREIERWNPGLGLVKASGADLVVSHVLDSLAGLPAFTGLVGGSVLLDLGSGAGFPGMPLALARADLRLVLLDRSSKRCTFLEHCAALLGALNVRVHRGDGRLFRDPVEAVTFRAVAPLTAAFVRGTPALARAPLVVAYKGTLTRAREELDAVRPLFAAGEILPLRVPFLRGERHLVVLRR